MTDYSTAELKAIIAYYSVAIKNQVRSEATWAGKPGEPDEMAAIGRRVRTYETRLFEAVEELANRSSDV